MAKIFIRGDKEALFLSNEKAEKLMVLKEKKTDADVRIDNQLISISDIRRIVLDEIYADKAFQQEERRKESKASFKFHIESQKPSPEQKIKNCKVAVGFVWNSVFKRNLEYEDQNIKTEIYQRCLKFFKENLKRTIPDITTIIGKSFGEMPGVNIMQATGLSIYAEQVSKDKYYAK